MLLSRRKRILFQPIVDSEMRAKCPATLAPSPGGPAPASTHAFSSRLSTTMRLQMASTGVWFVRCV